MEEAKIDFPSMKGFQTLDNGNQRIETIRLLDSAREIVTVFGELRLHYFRFFIIFLYFDLFIFFLESFGKLLSPAVNDIKGNIEKLQKTYNLNKCAFTYLEDMITESAKDPTNIAVDALLWMGRGLELIEQFLLNVLNDEKAEDNLKYHFKSAYQATLEQHHNFIVRESIRLLSRMTPTRKTLFGTGEKHTENMKGLEKILPPFRENIEAIGNIMSKV